MSRLALVLHTHLPWVRRNGTYPVGEEWLFQAAADAYLPLLDVLERLAADGYRDVLTLGITPILAEQLDDAYVLRELHSWLGRRLLDLEKTVTRYRGADRDRLRDVWAGHWRRHARLLEVFEARVLATGLTAPFRALAEAGVIELLGGPHTHPYLPLVTDAAVLDGQICGGLDVAERAFGRRPRGVWTPECGYRPSGPVGDPTVPPLRVHADGTPVLAPSGVELEGLEVTWARAGVDHLILDGPTLALAAGAEARDWSVVGGDEVPPGGPLDVLDGPVWVGDADLAAFGRNLPVSYAVWNPHGGYPGDPWYREFHHTDAEGGFKSWRVTEHGAWHKEPYDAGAAAARVGAHAEHFVWLVHRHLAPRPDGAMVVAAYDTELFGHWWHEGPAWLEEVVRRIGDGSGTRSPGGAGGDLATTTLAAAIDRRPPDRRLRLPESSWGRGKGHASWVDERTRWIWQEVRAAEQRFDRLPDGPARDAAWRQLCLLSASDWPFLVTAGAAAEYAAERVRTHAARFDQACRGDSLDELAAIDGAAPAPARAGAPIPA